MKFIVICFMNKIFLYPPANDFDMFGLSHLFCILMLLAVVMLIYLNRHRLSTFRKEKLFRYTLGILILLDLLAYNAYNYFVGIWRVENDLPLYLCSMNMVLCGILVFTKNRHLFDVLYFWGICGTSQALITPSLCGYGFPHFRFFQYMIGHIGIIVIVLYMLFVHKFTITLKSLFKSLFWLNVYGGIILVVNTLLSSNYMTLMGPADTPSILDYLPHFPYNLPVLEAIAIIFFLIGYLPLYIWQKKTSIKKNPLLISDSADTI